MAVQSRVALDEGVLADAAQLHARRFHTVREIGVAVAELLRQVEPKPVGELDRACDRVAIVGEALEHVGGRGEHGFVVAAPLALAAVERRMAANGDEHVLERRAVRIVRVHVAGRDRLNLQRLCEVAERDIPLRVAALVRALQLDEEALPAERVRKPRCRVRVAYAEAVARAAGEADEPLVQLLEQARVEARWEQLAAVVRARARVRVREEPAEVRVALRGLDEQRHVGAPFERDLGAGDRANAEVLRGVRELERAVDPVVVGQRERLVAELGRPGRQLLGQGCPVEERVGAVGMKLDVAHTSVLHEHTFDSNLEAARIERRRLGRRLVPGEEGRHRLGGDRGQEDPVSIVAARDEEALPVADQRPVVGCAGPQARDGLDELELRDGGNRPDRLPEQERRRLVGRRLVEARRPRSSRRGRSPRSPAARRRRARSG